MFQRLKPMIWLCAINKTIRKTQNSEKKIKTLLVKEFLDASPGNLGGEKEAVARQVTARANQRCQVPYYTIEMRITKIL